jgi:predicted nucleotidyltransferase
MLLSLVLYGSRARGDHRAKSDVDLLGLTEQGAFKKEISAGGTSLYHYPALEMLKKARSGDLFILHVVTEGKCLHDTFGAFRSVKDAFQYRDSYAEVIRDASLIIRFLSVRDGLLRKKEPRKRMIWAIRTILIARAAEERNACFSSAALAAFSRITELKDVIDNRNLADVPPLLKVAAKVLARFGDDLSGADWPTGLAEQRELLRATGGIARDTLRFAQPIGLSKTVQRDRSVQPLADGEYF